MSETNGTYLNLVAKIQVHMLNKTLNSNYFSLLRKSGSHKNMLLFWQRYISGILIKLSRLPGSYQLFTGVLKPVSRRQPHQFLFHLPVYPTNRFMKDRTVSKNLNGLVSSYRSDKVRINSSQLLF